MMHMSTMIICSTLKGHGASQYTILYHIIYTGFTKLIDHMLYVYVFWNDTIKRTLSYVEEKRKEKIILIQDIDDCKIHNVIICIQGH